MTLQIGTAIVALGFVFIAGIASAQAGDILNDGAALGQFVTTGGILSAR